MEDPVHWLPRAGEKLKQLRRREAGWEAAETNRQTIMTNEHDSAEMLVTSLLATGEVSAAARQWIGSLEADERVGPIWVVGDGMSVKEHARKCGRPAGVQPQLRLCLAGVRAAIVVKKRGNSRGAKGGRKANGSIEP